jgi:hypothetical protein
MVSMRSALLTASLIACHASSSTPRTSELHSVDAAASVLQGLSSADASAHVAIDAGTDGAFAVATGVGPFEGFANPAGDGSQRVIGFTKDDAYLGYQVSRCDPCPAEFEFESPTKPRVHLKYRSSLEFNP